MGNDDYITIQPRSHYGGSPLWRERSVWKGERRGKGPESRCSSMERGTDAPISKGILMELEAQSLSRSEKAAERRVGAQFLSFQRAPLPGFPAERRKLSAREMSKSEKLFSAAKRGELFCQALPPTNFFTDVCVRRNVAAALFKLPLAALFFSGKSIPHAQPVAVFVPSSSSVSFSCFLESLAHLT